MLSPPSRTYGQPGLLYTVHALPWVLAGLLPANPDQVHTQNPAPEWNKLQYCLLRHGQIFHQGVFHAGRFEQGKASPEQFVHVFSFHQCGTT